MIHKDKTILVTASAKNCTFSESKLETFNELEWAGGGIEQRTIDCSNKVVLINLIRVEVIKNIFST